MGGCFKICREIAKDKGMNVISNHCHINTQLRI